MKAPRSPENKGVMVAAAAVLGSLFLTRGGLASLGPLVRFALPVLVVVFAVRLLKGRLSALLGQTVQRSAPAGHASEGPGSGIVIDLCPRCGSQLHGGHRCAPRP